MARMSNRDFAARVNSGGASRNLATGEEVAPGYGFATSVAGSESVHRSAGARDVAAHRSRITRTAAQQGLPADRMMQGGWRYGNQSYLDLSRLFNDRRDPARTQAGAMEFGRAQRQIAVYDFGNDRSLYTAAPQTGSEALGYGGNRALGYPELAEKKLTPGQVSPSGWKPR